MELSPLSYPYLVKGKGWSSFLHHGTTCTHYKPSMNILLQNLPEPIMLAPISNAIEVYNDESKNPLLFKAHPRAKVFTRHPQAKEPPFHFFWATKPLLLYPQANKFSPSQTLPETKDPILIQVLSRASSWRHLQALTFNQRSNPPLHLQGN